MYKGVKMNHAVLFSIGHANHKLTRGIGLPGTTNISLTHSGQEK